MKKILTLFAAVAALLACSKVEEVSTPDIAEVQNAEFTFNINVGGIEPQTRAIKTGWENGDVINIWFNADSQEEPDLKMTYSNGKWTYGNLRKGVYFNDSGYIKAIYESFNDLSKYSYSSGYFHTFHEVETRTNYNLHPMVLYTKQHTYTCSSNTVTADLSDKWTFQSQIQIVVTGLDGDNAANYALHCPQLRPINAFGLTERNAAVSKGYSGSYVAGVKNADGVAFYFFDNMNTTNGEYYDCFYLTLYEYSSNGKILSERIYDVEGKSLTPSTKQCQGIKIDGSKFVLAGAKAVNLGLSVKWATFNVGASSPEETGDYYAWGETKTKPDFNWSTYFDNPSDDGKTFTKYNNDGGKAVLDPADDVAHMKWGGKWRMPTDAEWKELIDKCDWTWTNDYNGSGEKGIVVKSTNGNSIFLPGAGYRYGTTLSYPGSYGSYWSSSLLTDDPRDAWLVAFDSGVVTKSTNFRCYGRSVRPVSE